MKLNLLKYLSVFIWSILILIITFIFEGKTRILLEIIVTIVVLLTSTIYFNKKEDLSDRVLKK